MILYLSSRPGYNISCSYGIGMLLLPSPVRFLYMILRIYSLRVLIHLISAPYPLVMSGFRPALACSYCEVPEYAQRPNDEGYMEITAQFPTKKHIVKGVGTLEDILQHLCTAILYLALLTGFQQRNASHPILPPPKRGGPP
ncbi:hypothetical protein BS47DRAFT_378680 [Hydnum rufescens UP504]|uniref:Uncharacterized protein n=1 Tax=Hydnum rufescens UP504 TaxID=1448309 RepID=A0A9P6DPY5_9AGAM|nr:hypothetical protein BS47DRAFT_378680 [Hydnum rufescens UP504]